MKTEVNAREGNSLADQLAQRIRAKLQSNSYGDGDVFMTEAQLANEFDVSRTIVREAVSRLRALGILEGRQGKGLVVRRPDLVRLISESVPSLAGTAKDYRDLIDLRYVLEVGGIEHVVRNATDEQIVELEQIASEFSSAINDGKDVLQWRELDLRFHTLLLVMTNSPLVSGLNKVLARFFAVNRTVKAGDDDTEETELRQHPETARQHFELVAAIRDRDVERARYMIRRHIACYLTDAAAQDSRR